MQKLLTFVGRQELEDLPTIGKNFWHEYQARRSNFAMNKGWKERVEDGDRICSALMDAGVKLIDQGRNAQGNQCLQMGSEALAGVMELQKYLCVDPTGDGGIDRATEALAVIDMYMSVPDMVEETPVERGEMRVGLPEQCIRAHCSKSYKLTRKNFRPVGSMLREAWKEGIPAPVRDQDVVDTLRRCNCFGFARTGKSIWDNELPSGKSSLQMPSLT